MSRTFLLQSVVFSVSFSLVAACAGSGGSTSGPLPQTGALAVGAQRSVSSIAALHPPAVTYKSLYSFKGGTDGRGPFGAALIDVKGILYGTTLNGGGSNRGTVFTVSTSGTESVLHSFGGADGSSPSAALIDVNGTLYGTTGGGGPSNGGTVFAMSTSGTESVLHSFELCCGTGTDGSYPELADLTSVNGTLYGTTTSGGVSGHGTVFAVSTSGAERVLHNFGGGGGGADGSTPFGGLTYANGTLYGTTAGGGANGGGTVFAVNTSGQESVLYSFACCGAGTDGSDPQAGLIDVNGTLYGTTISGGASNGGTVFAVSTSGTESVIYSFKGGTDGSIPEAGLIDVHGALYGTTSLGGASNGGTVFAVSKSGTESVLHSFGSGTDGSNPQAGLIAVKGDLYGTTYSGGANGLGTVFKVSL
jgi:uncharacterized repeat protein (TIGR03803 family)